ncbi:long-chain fatty acid--CoA ligase [Euzebya sp.]|uniref:long-chain fatty acid--CoA ligase n=1 Tax=Euzebya sp. TaxID=1971409 RepID=UPI003519BE81
MFPGLMQDEPLTLRTVVDRASSLFATKTITTRQGDGFVTQTFGETVQRARRLAGALSARGIGDGDRVATFAMNTARHVELYVAVPVMGAVLHTLNPRLAPGQISYIANHAADRIVFADESLRGAWTAVEGLEPVDDVIWMDDQGTGIADGLDYEDLLAEATPLPAEWPRLDERQAAAMCYTSGTTGNPKGVVYSHRSATLHSLGSLFADTLAISERDVVMPIVPQFHANAWGTIYAALMAGASLAMPSLHMDPESITRLVEEAGVTMSAAVPTVWFGVLEAVRSGQIDPARLSTLERIACGGSAVPEGLMRGFDELGIRIVHAWGMTETSPLGTVATVKSTIPADDEMRTRLTQGIVMPPLRVRVVTEDGSVADWDGETMGELEISGPWIADAYYDPEQPDGRGGQESFATDPDGTRWLRTGDVAVIDAEGYVRLTDRMKDLVKSGGEWISTVDLENHLIGHPKVAEAAVIAVPHPRWDERPVACVVKADESLTAEELLDHAAERFAKWQLPDEIIFIDEVPKTSVGKFDKKVLRSRFADHQLPS